MSDGTKIEWAANPDGSPGATWNPIRARNRQTGKVGWFCVHASDGCAGCYAEAFNARLGTGVDYKAQNEALVEIFLDEETLKQPERWRKPRTIFPFSMTDLFGVFVPDAMIDRVLNVIIATPRHTYIVLTKRADRMRDYFARAGVRNPDLAVPDDRWPLPNLWLGVSAERQREADQRLPQLRATPAAVRLVSFEPLLGEIVADLTGIDWAIVGGESGANARPMHPDWARSLRQQCAAAGVRFFFKQWGEWKPLDYRSDDGDRRFVKLGCKSEPIVLRSPDERDTQTRVAGAVNMKRVGKKNAGRILDGRTHDDRPPFPTETLL